MISKIINRALELERTVMNSNEEPEVGINNENNMLIISRYSESRGSAEWIEDFCCADDIDLNKLRERLNKEHVAYCF